MNPADDPFLPLAAPAEINDFALLSQRPAAVADARVAEVARAAAALPAPVLARLHGFDLLERPEVTGLPGLPGQRLVARSTVALRHAQIGQDVLLVFEDGDVHRPIILGVLGTPPQALAPAVVEADGERQLIEAEREIVLRCGDASITLTRAGKVIIQGRYILSRSSGYNKLKGAAVDIN